MTSIRSAMEHHFRGQYWVMAEMNKLNRYQHSGHCYPELVEKTGNQVVAQARAVIWKGDYERINLRFLEILREPLKDGIKILFLCKVSFDAVHGLSLRVLDIDPSFTLGDLEKEKAESIRKLREEGIFEQNGTLTLPLLPSRIAVISVESSKGFADFNRILDLNPGGYRVSRTLFPSLLQGDGAVHGIMQQLKKIRKQADRFDAVTIIRGGGGDIGLSCYNNYNLAREVATFPLPVLTGIGHATNETVVELVAHTNCITPTKVAEFLLSYYRNFSAELKELTGALINISRLRMKDEQHGLLNTRHMIKKSAGLMLSENKMVLSRFHTGLYHSANNALSACRREFEVLKVATGSLPGNILANERTALQPYSERLQSSATAIIAAERRGIGEEERTVANLHPDKVLQRGYSLNLKDGRIITGISGITTGDEITTVMKDGSFTSKVFKIPAEYEPNPGHEE